jgi:hypothetical protein
LQYCRGNLCGCFELGIRLQKLQMGNVYQNQATVSVTPTKYIVPTLWDINFSFTATLPIDRHLKPMPQAKRLVEQYR